MPITGLNMDTTTTPKEEIRKALLGKWSKLLGFSFTLSVAEAQALLDLFGNTLDKGVVDSLTDIVDASDSDSESEHEGAGDFDPDDWDDDEEEGTSTALAAPSIALRGGRGETTDVRSASDLLVWLVSHPTTQAETPTDFSNSETLLKVLRKLSQLRGVIDHPTVWNVLGEVTAGGKAKRAGGEPQWPKGDWGTRDTKELGAQEWDQPEAPLEFRRIVPEDLYKAQLDAVRKRIAGHQLVGVHATTMDNVGPLMLEGVAALRIGSGHGKGKGPGFYFIPSPGGMKDVAKAEDLARGWGSSRVAVFLPDHCERKVAGDLDTVEKLEANKQQGKDYFYEFGPAEAVIPAALFSQILLVRDPADITQADPRLPAQPTRESAVSFLQRL
jgi:hypothetical protein